KAIKNFHLHLSNGGILIFDPWLDGPTYRVGEPVMSVYDGRDIKIVRLSVQDVKGGMTHDLMHFLVAEKGKPVKHFTVLDEGGLFDKKKVLSIMKAAGFDARYVKKGLSPGLGLYIGIKR
ncbi:MAG: hypothetical protein KGH60_05290, partial [Candidatus Micrarchaeota archaeon]|nr:hypothetical protein [Candidatus Micrarchaeota archaeon]